MSEIRAALPSWIIPTHFSSAAGEETDIDFTLYAGESLDCCFRGIDYHVHNDTDENVDCRFICQSDGSIDLAVEYRDFGMCHPTEENGKFYRQFKIVLSENMQPFKVIGE